MFVTPPEGGISVTNLVLDLVLGPAKPLPWPHPGYTYHLPPHTRGLRDSAIGAIAGLFRGPLKALGCGLGPDGFGLGFGCFRGSISGFLCGTDFASQSYDIIND